MINDYVKDMRKWVKDWDDKDWEVEGSQPNDEVLREPRNMKGDLDAFMDAALACRAVTWAETKNEVDGLETMMSAWVSQNTICPFIKNLEAVKLCESEDYREDVKTKLEETISSRKPDAKTSEEMNSAASAAVDAVQKIANKYEADEKTGRVPRGQAEDR